MLTHPNSLAWPLLWTVEGIYAHHQTAGTRLSIADGYLRHVLSQQLMMTLYNKYNNNNHLIAEETSLKDYSLRPVSGRCVGFSQDLCVTKSDLAVSFSKWHLLFALLCSFQDSG